MRSRPLVAFRTPVWLNDGRFFSSGGASLMSTATHPRRSPLGLFPGKPVPRLYDRIVQVLRIRHYSPRTEEACLHWIRIYTHVLSCGGRGVRSPADALAHAAQ
jgi:hypothetical protein